MARPAPFAGGLRNMHDWERGQPPQRARVVCRVSALTCVARRAPHAICTKTAHLIALGAGLIRGRLGDGVIRTRVAFRTIEPPLHRHPAG